MAIAARARTAADVGRQQSPRPPPTPEGEFEPLPFGEQLGRDARTRTIAAGAVVFAHAAYAPGHPVLATQPPVVAALESLAYVVIQTFPINAFILLSALSVGRRLEAGSSGGQALRAAARRLLPMHLFWVAVFLGIKAVVAGAPPSPRAVVEGVLFGTAASHLYFTPLLLTLTAAAPLLALLARTPPRAILSGFALALSGITLHLMVEPGSPWGRLAGALGLAPYFLAGLAFARAWRGVAPPASQSGLIRRTAAAVAVLSLVVLVHPWFLGEISAIPLNPATWLARIGYALSVPVLLLALGGRVPARFVRYAPWTLGVYFIHPLFLEPLKLLEGRMAPLAGMEALLVVPNAIVAALLSLLAVAVLVRTPLRRVVT